MRLKSFILSFTIILPAFCMAQVQTYYVKPVLTDPAYDSAEDSSAISRNAGSQLNKLFLFFGGTSSSSSADYVALRLFSANLGFDFINLSYPNQVAAASLANNSDSMAFNHYRQELCFGTPLSEAVDVDSLHSIYTRALKLLQYLDNTYPSQNWDQYLINSNTLDWSKIIVGGHSQGSGHACYFAKKFPVERALMFSGPNDYSDYYSNSAHWIREKGVTPVSRHYSYLSLDDEAIPYYKQYAVIAGLDMLSEDDSTYVDNLSSPYANSHCLYTTQSPGLVILHHNVPIMLSTINSNVWTYMLTSPITTGLKNPSPTNPFTVFPNPVTSILNIRSSLDINGKMFILQNIAGDTLISGKISATDQFKVDMSALNPGLYFLMIEQHVSKVIKN